MLRSLIVTSTIALSSSLAHAESVPHVFSAGTPAKASEVNENFEYLKQQIDALSQNFQLESVEVDCSENPSALQEAYVERITEIHPSFIIKGRCYADLSDPGGESLWQVYGQHINIRGDGESSAALIPDPVTGYVSLWGGFNGGLFVSDLTIETNDGRALGFSRNAQGTLDNVKIIAKENSSRDVILVQASSQLYISGVEIIGGGTAVNVTGNSIVRFFNHKISDDTFLPALKTTGVERGIFITAGSAIRQQGAVELGATEHSLIMRAGSAWHSDVWVTGTVFSADVELFENSTAFLNDTSFTGSKFTVNASRVSFNDTQFDYGKLHCYQLGQVNVDGVSNLLATAPDSNCIDQHAAQKLVNLLKN